MGTRSYRAPAGILLTAAMLAAAAENPAMPEKMCWAHFCGWGFNVRTTYDEPEGFLRLYDRTLLGLETGTDLGVASSRRGQIEEARRYGIDGFCVDIPRLDGYRGLGSLYEAAEGLPFKIALCVDGWPGTLDEVVDALSTFLTDWGSHPNNYFIDGRPVIFIYQHGRSLADCRVILDRLAARGLRAYWLVQPQGETSDWGTAAVLQEHLQVFDGLYDFGVNGFLLPQMVARLRNGREALQQARPKGLLCAGLSQGYLGPHNGFYRPYFGTGTLRDNWAAAMATNADWVCLCTWNDFWETTHFEPAVWSRDVMLKLNRDLLRQWRGEPYPSRPPQVLVAYKEEVTLGDDWSVEVTSLPYTTPAAVCQVRLLTPEGTVCHEFGPLALPRGELTSHALSLPAPGLEGPRELRLQAGVTTVGDPKVTWSELYPLLIRPGGMRAWRTVRFDLRDLLPSPALTTQESPEGTRLTATFPSWSWWGRAELLRNGVEIGVQEIAKFGPVDTAISFLVKPGDRRLARDLFVIRLTRHDRRFVYSPPCLLGEYSGEPVTLPVLVRGTDFDEGWGSPHWRSPWRLESPEIREVAVAQQEVWRVFLPLDADRGDTCADHGGWQVQARRGVRDRWGGTALELQPAWVSAAVNGAARAVLRFDGENDNVTFPFRTLPPGALTAEFLVRPTRQGTGTLFSDQNGGLDIRIDEQGRVVVQRQETRLTDADVLAVDAWHHLAVVYDYRELRLYRNGVLSARGQAPAGLRGINSRSVIGALCREGQPLTDPFAGELAGFALTARPLVPADFALKQEPR